MSRRPNRLLTIVSLAVLLPLGCGDDDADPTEPDLGTDLAQPDGDADADADAGDPWEGFVGVRIDLEPYRQADGTGTVARVATADDLLHGHRAFSRPGDYYLANDRIRAVVRGGDRAMNPAPWGGSLFEADVVRPAGEPVHNEIGDVSLLVNFERTLLPEDFAVLYDGSDGGGAVLAVTGRDTVNDFINVPLLLVSNLGPSAQLALESGDLELSITQYYVLNPGETRVRLVTAVRNDGDSDRIIVLGELIHAGDAGLFNPNRGRDQFGAPSQPIPEDVPSYVAWVGEGVAYAYVPRPGGEPSVSMSVSGVTGCLAGAENIFDFLGERALDPQALPPGAALLAPDGVHVWERDVYVGPDLAAVDAAWRATSGQPLGSLAGTVELAAALPPTTRVAVLQAAENLLVTQFEGAADGSFSGRLPPGTYRLRAEAPGHPFSDEVTVTIADGEEATATLTIPAAAEVTVAVSLPDGSPSPAKVTFVCVAECPRLEGGLAQFFRDTGRDRLPGNVEHVGFVGPSGEATFRVSPGDYRVVVSRGAEYSVWPNGWPGEPGDPWTFVGGESVQVDAEIALVLDTAGWISGDLHVHGSNSVDTFVRNERRVLSFLAEGVDVLVSTDHEVVTDYSPWVTALGAESQLVTLLGNELTTFDWGHFNTYPIELDPESRTGSYIDWGNGEGPTFNPTQLFAAMAAAPSPVEEPVVQLNHPRGSLGHFTAIGLDTASFATAADPATFRMDPPAGAEVGVDTRLFDPSFTAMEIYNGWSVGAFTVRLNDWFAFLQRGLVVTAVAVSDTHKEFSAAVGSPRSWIEVGTDHDSPATFDVEGFARGLNEGRLMGGNGPFLRVRADSGAASAGPGELLSVDASSGVVTLTIGVEVPAWFGIDRIEVYANIEGTDARPFEEHAEAPDATHVLAVDLAEEATVPGVSVAGDADSAHRRWVIERTLDVTPEVDTWYVVIVRGSTSGFPVILEPSVTALVFTNPILVDADGNGAFDAPAAVERRPVGAVQRPYLVEPAGPRLTEDELRRFVEALDHLDH